MRGGTEKRREKIKEEKKENRKKEEKGEKRRREKERKEDEKRREKERKGEGSEKKSLDCEARDSNLFRFFGPERIYAKKD